MRANAQILSGVAVIIIMRFEVSHPIEICSTAVMTTPTLKTVHVPFLIAGLAAFLFSGVAMSGVAILQWFQGPSEPVSGILAAGQNPPTGVLSDLAQGLVKPRCEECGVVDSNRWLAATGDAPGIYEITVRMRDGSMRVLNDPRPASLRPGERIILIGGHNPPGR